MLRATHATNLLEEDSLSAIRTRQVSHGSCVEWTPPPQPRFQKTEQVGCASVVGENLLSQIVENQLMNPTTELFMAMLTVSFAAIILVAAQLFTENRNRTEAASLIWSPASVAQARTTLR
jgi:hypothetical protein